jgi:3-oxoacyl-[acyl-carrier protein] reductase
MESEQKLKGKNVLITAGAQGIGEAITKHFISAGANVAIHYFSSETIAIQLVNEAQGVGLKAVALQADLTKETEAKTLVEETVASLGGLDILINNAGSLVARKMLHEIEAEFWQKVMDINLTSMMYVTRAAAAHLEKNEKQ